MPLGDHSMQVWSKRTKANPDTAGLALVLWIIFNISGPDLCHLVTIRCNFDPSGPKPTQTLLGWLWSRWRRVKKDVSKKACQKRRIKKGVSERRVKKGVSKKACKKRRVQEGVSKKACQKRRVKNGVSRKACQKKACQKKTCQKKAYQKRRVREACQKGVSGKACYKRRVRKAFQGSVPTGFPQSLHMVPTGFPQGR